MKSAQYTYIRYNDLHTRSSLIKFHPMGTYTCNGNEILITESGTRLGSVSSGTYEDKSGLSAYSISIHFVGSAAATQCDVDKWPDRNRYSFPNLSCNLCKFFRPFSPLRSSPPLHSWPRHYYSDLFSSPYFFIRLSVSAFYVSCFNVSVVYYCP